MRFLGRLSMEVEEERKIGFHSRQVLCYFQTADPRLIAVVVAPAKGRQIVFYVQSTFDEFYRAKVKAEDEDVFVFMNN